MQLYKVNDLCEGKNFDDPLTVRFNGVECTILKCMGELHGAGNGVWYHVDWANGEKELICAREDKLKLKRPPEALGKWEHIVGALKYDPRKAPVKEDEHAHA